MTIMDSIANHVDSMTRAASNNRAYYKHWHGESPAVWISKESREALDNSLARLGTNFTRLAVTSLVERLTLRGWNEAGVTGIDEDMLALAHLVDLPALSEIIHTDRALYGESYATVWATADGQAPTVIAGTGDTVSVRIDPATRRTVEGVRLWRDGDTAHIVHFTPETVRRYATDLVQGASVTPHMNWKQDGPVEENALQAVPIVRFQRKLSSLDVSGVSAVSDILGLEDAQAKVLADAMVTSEYFAKPRRWATGLEIMEDEAGKPVDPFGKSRLLQSEDPETKFGQLNASSPSGQVELIATLTQQIGALTGLPAHYLGLHGDQPASAEGVRAAESQLVNTARTEMKHLSGPWSRVASLLSAVEHGGHPDDYRYITQWENPEIKTPAQAADAAGKLRDIGLPLATLLSDPLGYDPEDIPDIVAAASRENLLANVNLGGGDIGA